MTIEELLSDNGNLDTLLPDETRDYLEGLMHLVKLFKGSYHSYFYLYGRRAFSASKPELYVDKNFLAEIDLSMYPIPHTNKPVLNKFYRVLNNHQLLTCPVYRMLVEVDSFYKFFSQMSKDKTIGVCNKVLFKQIPDQYFGNNRYGIVVVSGSGDLVYENCSINSLNISSRIPRKISWRDSVLPDIDEYGSNFEFVGMTTFGDNSWSLLNDVFNKESPLDAILSNNPECGGLVLKIGEYSSVDVGYRPSSRKYFGTKRFSISRNVFPKEMNSENSTIIASIYESIQDAGHVYLIRLTALVDKSIGISSDFETLVVSEE